MNSDSPTLPTACLIRAAHALLVPGDRIVLGPVDDGGYYLLAMEQPHPRRFADIAWSTNGARATAPDPDVVLRPAWYDMDNATTVDRLVTGAEHGYIAPNSNACIERNALRGRLSLAAQ